MRQTFKKNEKNIVEYVFVSILELWEVTKKGHFHRVQELFIQLI